MQTSSEEMSAEMNESASVDDGMGVDTNIAEATADESAQDMTESGASEVEAVAEPSELEVLQAERDKLKDTLLRTAADFDNFRKRTRKDLEQAENRAKESVLRELLPVFDNLERAMDASGTEADAAAIQEGVQMVIKLFADTGERIGLERITSLGERFDPAMHEAMQQLETPDHEPGTVMTEYMAGYRLKGRLIRPAMVVVARKPSAEE